MSDTVITIGVTGHRPNRLAPGRTQPLRGEIEGILRWLIAAAPRPAAFWLLSSLAEGADRIAAEAALAARIALVCPLPFPADRYCRDFASPASREAFRALLARADEVVELPGSRRDAEPAYAAAGEWMLARSHILLAIWDGGDSAGHGGTRDLIGRALSRGMPVIWFHAARASGPCWLDGNPAGQLAAGAAIAGDTPFPPLAI